MFTDNEILNGKITYKVIAQNLINRKPVLIGWSDGRHVHKDILFTYKPKKIGGISKSIKDSDFYISIISDNSYGFLIEDKIDNRKDISYIREKLNLETNSSTKAICDLINGIINQIDIMEGRQ